MPGASKVEVHPVLDELFRRKAVLALEDLSRRDVPPSTGPPCADLPALLRRCILFLHFLEARHPALAARTRRRLLASLRGVLARDPSPSLLPALEVFIENLVVSNLLRTYLDKADRGAPEESKMFAAALPDPGAFHTVMELLCCHFISSLEGGGGFEAFLSTLSWSEKALQGSPEIGFPGAVTLINKTYFFSMPSIVQAHLLLLTSRCIRVQYLRPNLVPFQGAMDLYLRYLPALGVFTRNSSAKISLRPTAKKSSFSSCIKDATDQKLQNQISKLLSFCQPRSDDDIFGSYECLIEDNQHLLHEKFRKEATTVLKRVFSDILDCAKQKEMLDSDAVVSEEIICLAAVVRLMGSLLIQFLQHFSQMRPASGTETKYNDVCEAILPLGQYEANEHHRCNLFGIISAPIDRKKASMLLFAHFTSVSVCCARRRLGFLWKGCIIMMIMAINLVTTDEQNMSMFKVAIDVSEEFAVLHNTGEGSVKAHVTRQSSKAILRRFVALQKPRAEKTDGREYLKLHPQYPRYNPSSWDDIADYIECEQGRDYPNCVKQNKKFKRFKDEKWFRKRASVRKIELRRRIELRPN